MTYLIGLAIAAYLVVVYLLFRELLRALLRTAPSVPMGWVEILVSAFPALTVLGALIILALEYEEEEERGGRLADRIARRIAR